MPTTIMVMMVATVMSDHNYFI